MNYDWDLTYILDGNYHSILPIYYPPDVNNLDAGMTTVEHAIPIPTLYEDVLNLFALSGTGSTPTHLVNYGGAWGEQFVWANEDVPTDPK